MERMMRAILAILFTLLALSARAEARDAALVAAGIDCFTTGEALAGTGTHEVNPLGAARACALKIPLVLIANQFPEPDRTVALHTQRAVWDGAGAHNLALIVGVSSTVSTGVGIVVALALWESGAEEREFMRLCAIHEQMAGHPMTCNYTPSHT